MTDKKHLLIFLFFIIPFVIPLVVFISIVSAQGPCYCAVCVGTSCQLQQSSCNCVPQCSTDADCGGGPPPGPCYCAVCVGTRCLLQQSSCNCVPQCSVDADCYSPPTTTTPPAPTTTTPPAPTTTTPPAPTTTTTPGSTTTTIPGGTTTTTSTTTTTTIPPLTVSCTQCFAKSECICELKENCDSGIWATKNIDGSPLSENKFQNIPPTNFTFTPVSTGKIQVKAVCDSPSPQRVGNVTIDVNKQFLECEAECLINSVCSCHVNGCKNGNFLATQENIIIYNNVIRSESFLVNFIPVKVSNIDALVTCTDPSKMDSATILVSGTPQTSTTTTTRLTATTHTTTSTTMQTTTTQKPTTTTIGVLEHQPTFSLNTILTIAIIISLIVIAIVYLFDYRSRKSIQNEYEALKRKWKGRRSQYRRNY